MRHASTPLYDEGVGRGITLVSLLVLCTTAWAQRAVSARAGMINYQEGRVSLDGKRVRITTSRFPQMKAGQTLVTAQRARAELLLNPTTFLRIGDSSSIKLVSDDLTDTRVTLLTGSIVVDVQELDNLNKVTIQIADSAVELRKEGQYHLTATGGGKARVYDGEARVGEIKLTKGWELIIGKEPAKFDRDQQDSLVVWSAQREKMLNPPVPVRRPRPPPILR